MFALSTFRLPKRPSSYGTFHSSKLQLGFTRIHLSRPLHHVVTRPKILTRQPIRPHQCSRSHNQHSSLLTRRFLSKETPRKPDANASPPPSSAAYARIVSKLPTWLRPYVKDIHVSHVTAFLILHELSAIIPLGIVWWGIHYLGDVGSRENAVKRDKEDGEGEGESGGFGKWAADKWNGWIDMGVGKFGRYIQKKGYLSNTDPAKAAKIVLELGVAYAIVKAALPFRIVASLWATPWFARVVLGGIGRIVRRVVGRG